MHVQAMGGSAEPVHYPENDLAYDVDSSDEDLDGMEAAVARFEERRRRRAALEAMSSRSKDAASALEKEREETAAAVAALREQRRRFEEARAAGRPEPRGEAEAAFTAAPGSLSLRAREAVMAAAAEEDRERRALQRRREDIDRRLAALLDAEGSVDARRGGERDGSGASLVSTPVRAAAAAAVEQEYRAPRWKLRQEERWAAEAREQAALLEAEADHRVPAWKQRRDERREREAAEAAAAVGGRRDPRAGEGLLDRPRHQLPQPRLSASRGADEDLAGITIAAARAIQQNQTEALGQLLGRGGLPADAADENCDTLLALACKLGRKRATKILLRFGARVNAQNKQGLTPVDHCVENGHFTLADYLVKFAAKNNVPVGDE